VKNLEAIKDWWNQASVRDQLALVLLSSCVALYVLYAGVLKPVAAMRDKQIRTNISQMEALERVRDLASQWVSRAGNSDGGSAGGSLVQLVENSLRENGLRLNNMQPSGSDSVRLRLESVPFNSLIGWLNEMEVQQRLQIKDLSIASSKDAGLVSVNLRLQQE